MKTESDLSYIRSNKNTKRLLTLLFFFGLLRLQSQEKENGENMDTPLGLAEVRNKDANDEFHEITLGLHFVSK